MKYSALIDSRPGFDEKSPKKKVPIQAASQLLVQRCLVSLVSGLDWQLYLVSTAYIR